jgi:hypothetical protein
MKTRTIILLAIVALLLVGGVALRQAQDSALAQSSGPLELAGNAVKQSATSGGHYRLVSTSWQVSGVSSGGGYQLAVSLSPVGTGTPCCCTYLPCVLRTH